jgi:nucleotide-binding universal stress UspA family protein
MYTNLLVPTDGSGLSGKAVAHALGLALALKARIVVLYATPTYKPEDLVEGGGRMYKRMSKAEYVSAAAREAEDILKPAASKAAAAKVECKTVHALADAPWEAIIAAAKTQKCDAIVMASHGRRGVSALLLGSEAQKVLTHSTLPVLVVR